MTVRVPVVVIAVVRVIMIVVLPIAMRMFVRMFVRMIVPVIVPMIVPVIVPVIVRMIVPVIVPMIVRLLLRGAILMDTPGMPLLVVVVAMSAAVGAGLGLERSLERFDARAQAPQHGLEHVIGGDAQETVPDLHRHVPVTQMVGCPRQVRRRLAADVQHFLGLGNDFDDAAVTGDDQIATAQDFSAWQQQTHLFTRSERGSEPALLARIERQP